MTGAGKVDASGSTGGMAGSAPQDAAGGAGGPADGAQAPSPADVAERIADAVAALPDVAGLSAGHSVRLATYRAGPPVTGVAVRDDAVEVGVVARYGRPLDGIADDVRAAARPLSEGRRVDVLIADIDGADEPAEGGNADEPAEGGSAEGPARSEDAEEDAGAAGHADAEHPAG
ncbi:hypothetical protein [Actinomadura gamaensis]|uniref:Asp23/Gls24 family envelope stress response protein n=1 Tax=Actinomadura gamaensis TaxID=1763541 RepID=A0ABV9U949_9ACTN